MLQHGMHGVPGRARALCAWENKLKIHLTTVMALILVTSLTMLTVGWAMIQLQQPRSLAPPPPPEASSPETTAAVTAPLPPPEDVPGEEVPGLPRYPDSVRVGYERGDRGDLVVVRARYLSTEELDAVRGFYRGVFRSEGWTEADASFSAGEWTFHVTDDEREATVRISDLGPSVETVIELSEPAKTSPERSDPEPAPSQPPPPPRYDPTPATPPQYAPAPAPTPAPAPVPAPAPAPVPSDDYGDDDYGDDDFGDD